MFWIVAALILSAAAVVAAIGHWRYWMRPWRDVERLVDDVVNGRAPRTFIVDGNRPAARIGVALETIFLRGRDLERRAHENESDVRSILGAMRDGLAVVAPDGRVRLLNTAARELLNVRDESPAGTVMETFRDAIVAELVATTLRTGTTETRSINLRSGAADRQVAVTTLPMRRDDGHANGAIVLFHDVTQLQQLEQVRREFVSNVSHELRTPLSIFRGYLETLLDEPDLPGDERERILHVLEKHSARLHSLVDDLLSLARLEAPDPKLDMKRIDVLEFLRRTAREWEKKAASKQLSITLALDENLPPLAADEARLEEIVYNLLDNAVKYSAAGGVVTLSASRDGAGHIVMSVADNGAGIAAADLPRIFERFYRADKARSREVGGTGLGLAIVKHIAQLHGGIVEAESELSRGTTIRVRLPGATPGAEFTQM